MSNVAPIFVETVDTNSSVVSVVATLFDKAATDSEPESRTERTKVNVATHVYDARRLRRFQRRTVAWEIMLKPFTCMMSTLRALAIIVLSSSMSLLVGSDEAIIDNDTATETVSSVEGNCVGKWVGRRLCIDAGVGIMECNDDGVPEGNGDGRVEGEFVGAREGNEDGVPDGSGEGRAKSKIDGEEDGIDDGVPEGNGDGRVKGEFVGAREGNEDGVSDGSGEGRAKSKIDGEGDGIDDGVPEGNGDGAGIDAATLETKNETPMAQHLLK